MKWMTLLFTSLLALFLTACGEKEQVAPEVGSEDSAVTAPAPAAEVAPAAKSGGGGYEPSESERVPGITMTQEELDKIYAETRATTPMPQIPEEAK